MRITLVSPYDPDPPAGEDGNGFVGGVERVFAEVSRRLAVRGHETTVVCSSDEPGEDDRGGLRTIRVRRNGTILRAPVAPLAARIPDDADLVHVAATYPFTTPAALRRARDLGVPGILDFHFEPDPGHPVGRAAAAVYRRVGPPTYRLAHTALVRSYAYGRSAPSLAHVPEERWRVVPNGIDTRRFTPHGRAAGDGHVLAVGRLVPYKGVEVLVRALARHPVDRTLLVVGSGPLRTRLEDLARRLGVDARFLGRVAEEDLPTLYRGAALTVLPSVNRQEAFGITLLESMACGTPVVASALPGVADVARLGGLVATPGDPDDLARRIHEALASPDLPRGAALARRVGARYSWDAVTDRLESVYREVLGAPGPVEVTGVAHPGRESPL